MARGHHPVPAAPAPAPAPASALAAMNAQYYYPLIPHVSSSSSISGDEDMYKKFMFRKTLIVVACLLAAILVVAHWHTIARCIITAVSSRRRSIDQDDDQAEDVVLDTFKAEQGEDCKPLRPIQLVKFGRQQPALRSLTTTECTICLCEFAKGESIGVLPDCGHCFHRPCIGMWLFSHSSCPICRHSLEQQELEEP